MSNSDGVLKVQNKTFPMDIGWLAILKDLGVQPGHVLRRAGLPDDLLSRTRQGLSGEDYFRFWRALEAEASNTMFPLRLVETLSLILSTHHCSLPCAARIWYRLCSASPNTSNWWRP